MRLSDLFEAQTQWDQFFGVLPEPEASKAKQAFEQNANAIPPGPLQLWAATIIRMICASGPSGQPLVAKYEAARSKQPDVHQDDAWTHMALHWVEQVNYLVREVHPNRARPFWQAVNRRNFVGLNPAEVYDILHDTMTNNSGNKDTLQTKRGPQKATFGELPETNEKWVNVNVEGVSAFMVKVVYSKDGNTVTLRHPEVKDKWKNTRLAHNAQKRIIEKLEAMGKKVVPAHVFFQCMPQQIYSPSGFTSYKALFPQYFTDEFLAPFKDQYEQEKRENEEARARGYERQQ